MHRNERLDVAIGISVLGALFIGLAYKIGLKAASLCFGALSAAYILAGLALYLSSKTSKISRFVSILLWPEILYKFLLPRQYKERIQNMKAQSDDRSSN